MPETTVVTCQRCGARCRWDGAWGNPDAKMLRRSKKPRGLCVNCATHDWLRNTYPCNMILAKSGAAPLAYQHMRDQFAEIMRCGRADANPDEINWNLISENWDLPFQTKVKPTSTNPCNQKELDEITSGKRDVFRYDGDKHSEGFSEVKPEFIDDMRSLFHQPTNTKGQTKMAKKTKKTGEQLDLINVHPENEKEIVKAARAYKAIVKARLEIGKKEKEHKNYLIEVVEKAHLKPIKDGVVKFQVDSVEIKVTPRDKLVQVKELDPTKE